MIAGGDDVHPTVEEHIRHLGRDAEAVGRVLAVDDDGVGSIPVAEQGEAGEQQLTRRSTDDIAEKQDDHAIS
ncbi:MAG: hypothetical protein BWY79_01492 [Actinobacteria bacterium ADurb.Bin444]|nr:MAG: hypothetical protein BWY79_01492 [Actinobacteria bacterium ADurb.Bin444]